MPRRRPQQNRGRRHEADHRPLSLGSHWRADGQPKVGYASQGEAWSAADELRQEAGARLSVYQCDVCYAWHMGNRSEDADQW